MRREEPRPIAAVAWIPTVHGPGKTLVFKHNITFATVSLLDLRANNDPQSYGSGSDTVWVKSLTCIDPRHWNDEARMRAFRDNLGGDQIWDYNNMTKGTTDDINRYIHFNDHARLDLYDYDGSWSSSDKLGEEWIHDDEACGGENFGGFAGSGSGLDWDYDLTYQVFGPNCKCQAVQPPIYDDSQVETCSVTAQKITHYTYYCSGGTEWKQAWGDVTRHCKTYQKKYNTACELKTYVSQQLLSECDKYQTGVAIGGPVAYGTCPNPDCELQPDAQAPSHENQLHSNEQLPRVAPVIEPPICPI